MTIIRKFKKPLRLSILFIVFLFCNNLVLPDLAKNGNTFTGTDGRADNWHEGHYSTSPSMPFGLFQLSPDNKDGNQSSYFKNDKLTIKEFSHTHLSGAGADEGTDFRVMHTVGKIQLSPGTENNPDSEYRSRLREESFLLSVHFVFCG